MAMLALAACNGGQPENPLMADSALPYGAPEFSKYEPTDYEEAFLEGFNRQRAEIDAIVACTEAPTFDNTIGALERSGRLLGKVSGIFFNLSETDADSIMKETEKRIMPLMTEHNAYMTMNETLFARVKTIYDNKANIRPFYCHMSS